MRLLFLHGPPAAGKLTIARALLSIVPGRLLDNHSAIDFARTVFDFDAPGFWPLVADVRFAALERAGEHGVPLVVYTSCYADPADRPHLERVEALLAKHRGILLPVYLTCPITELHARISGDDRRTRGKLATVEGLNGVLTRWNIAAVPRANCHTIDTSRQSADASAREIVRTFSLNG